jgi:hypothetical protein
MEGSTENKPHVLSILYQYFYYTADLPKLLSHKFPVGFVTGQYSHFRMGFEPATYCKKAKKYICYIECDLLGCKAL